MEIKAFRYFVELVEQKSFTRASEQLFVTQPTISKMIRNLEQSVGQPLLHREGRRFWLTAAGEIVYQRAKLILDEVGQLDAELTDLNQLQRGQLRLGIPPMIGHLYAGLILRYRQLYPNVQMTIVEYGGHKSELALIQGDLDVAVIMLTNDTDPCLETLPLEGYPVYAILPDIPKWQQKTTMTWADIQDEPFYMYTEEFTLSDYIPQLCQQAGFVPKILARSSQWDFLVGMVKSGTGVTFLPGPLCRRIRGENVLVKAIQPSINWQLGVIWHRERYVAKTAEAWIQLCRESIRA